MGRAARQAAEIVAALGGRDNIVELEACITRLRTEVRDVALVDESALRSAGAHGVMRVGPVLQVVVGPDADPVASHIGDLLAPDPGDDPGGGLGGGGVVGG